MFLCMCLVNWLNWTKNNDIHKSISLQSTNVGFQGVKMRAETMNMADNHIKTESYDLSLIFSHYAKCA